ncbi:hypothetical protein T459_05015 [Capsicum annuum]|uniref:Uncharacterized protein n=1 Tax=Capsicum annuum TaxID=4072 RepID=A0A2G3A6P3_CAPAN|nr:hypothetical protein T459_05015 [Capsicum annuum]
MNMIQDLPDVVDISDPSGKINNQQVAYDWKPLFCKKCTRFGHICRREEPRPNKPQGRQNQDDNISVVLAEVKRNDANGQPVTTTTGGYKLVVATSDPKRIASPNIANIQGWLPGLKVHGDSNQLPTISIVASYDTFGAAPTFSVGSNKNGSGVVALLEIARLFYALYSNPKTRGRYTHSLD